MQEHSPHLQAKLYALLVAQEPALIKAERLTASLVMQVSTHHQEQLAAVNVLQESLLRKEYPNAQLVKPVHMLLRSRLRAVQAALLDIILLYQGQPHALKLQLETMQVM